MKLRTTCATIASVLLGSTALAQADTLTIATVNNSDMIIMQELSSQWEEATGHELNWVVLEENVLRQRVTTDIATSGGQFDIITIGSYEAPIWGAQGWLVGLNDLGDDYHYDDLFDSVRNGLSHDGTLYAVPFYAESSFTFYRTDLFEAAGLEMPEQPTYEQIAEFAAALHDADNDLYGICLRGKPGWGENMAFVSTLVNAFGGRWFDEEWQPQLTSEPWVNAINYYVDLMNNYGPPGASTNGHNENRALFASGNCAMWIDATSAAGYIYNPSESQVADVDRLRAGPDRRDRPRHRLVLVLGARHPVVVDPNRSGTELPRLGNQPGICPACRRDAGLGRGTAGHPPLDLCHRRLCRSRAVRQLRAERHGSRRPGEPDLGSGPLHRHSVCGDP